VRFRPANSPAMKRAFNACAVYFITACTTETLGHVLVKDRKVEKLFRGTVHRHGGQPERSESQDDRETVLGDLENEAVKLLEHYAVQDDVAVSPDFLEDLGSAEDALRQEGGDLEIIAKIKKARANICVEQQLEKHDHTRCEIFMNLACPLQDGPNSVPSDHDMEEKDKEKDEDDEEVPVPATLCDHFYLLGGKRVVAPDSGPAPGPVAAPAASPAGAPGPAAGPSPGRDPFAYTGPYFGTKRLRPLQEHGFHGEAVIHEDGETMTSDWQTEFGPAAGHRSFVQICKDFPDNEWCRLHLYDPQAQKWMNQKSGAGYARNSFAVLCAVAVACALGQLA